MNNRNWIRDLVVYSITSVRYLLLRGQFNLFVRDLLYFNQWRKYRVSAKGTIDHQVPWLVFSAIAFLEKWVQKNMQVFEYGSGGSTLYFASKAAQVASIEHDANWFGHAQKVIQQAGYNNINYQLIEPAPSPAKEGCDCTDPVNYVSCFREYKGYEFSTYATSIEKYPNEMFDLVVVDGRVRHSCIAHALKKIKPNGALLLDNADRAYYLKPFPELFESDKWQLINFVGHFPYGPASVLNTTKLFIKLT